MTNYNNVAIKVVSENVLGLQINKVYKIQDMNKNSTNDQTLRFSFYQVNSRTMEPMKIKKGDKFINASKMQLDSLIQSGVVIIK